MAFLTALLALAGTFLSIWADNSSAKRKENEEREKEIDNAQTDADKAINSGNLSDLTAAANRIDGLS